MFVDCRCKQSKGRMIRNVEICITIVDNDFMLCKQLLSEEKLLDQAPLQYASNAKSWS